MRVSPRRSLARRSGAPSCDRSKMYVARSRCACCAADQRLRCVHGRLLPLPLLVLGVLADHPHDTPASDDATLVTNLSDRCPNLHTCALLRVSPASVGSRHTGQNVRPVIGNQHRVLEVGRERAVSRARRPLVVVHPDVRTAHVHHGLDCKHHSRQQPRASPRLAEVRNLRRLVRCDPPWPTNWRTPRNHARHVCTACPTSTAGCPAPPCSIPRTAARREHNSCVRGGSVPSTDRDRHR